MSLQQSTRFDEVDAQSAIGLLALSLSEWIEAPGGASTAYGPLSDVFLARRADFICEALADDAGHDGARLAASLRWFGTKDLASLRLALVRCPTPGDLPAVQFVQWLDTACRAVEVGPPETAEFREHCAWIVRPLVDAARERAQTVLDNVPIALRDDVQEACAEIMRTPPERIATFALQAYVFERSIECTHRDSEPAATLSRWTAESRRRFFTLYPALARLVVTRTLAWADYAVELALRVVHDREVLRGWLGAPDGGVTDVRCGLGDEHAGGRTVTSLRIGGVPVIYKPRPVASLRFFRQLNREMGKIDSAAAPQLFAPEVLDRGDYGWVEWIECRSLENREDAARFYRQLGHLQAVAWVLGATDLHSWNVLASGDRPYVLDGETILAPLHRSSWKGSPGAHALAESPLMTGILPQHTGRDGGPDNSAYGDRPGQKTEMLLPIARHRDGYPVVEWQTPERPVGPAVPRWLDGDTVDATDYRDDFVEGFRSGVRFIHLHRHRLLSPEGVLARSDEIPVRVVLRNTADYGQLLLDTYHPHLMRDGALRERHFVVSLASVHEQRPEMAEVLPIEVKDLLAGEVPLFYVGAGGCDLIDAHGTRWPGFFAESPLALVRRRLKQLGDHELAAAEWCVDTALGAYRLNQESSIPAVECCRELLEAPPSPGLLLDAATVIGQRLLALAHRVGDSLVWLDAASTEGRQWRLDAGDSSLYRGSAGMLLFFHHLSALVDDEPAFADAARRLLASWLAMPQAEAIPSLGAFTGLAGRLYVALCLLRTRRSKALLGVVERSVRRIDARLDEPMDFDVISGAAGLAIVLTRILEHELPEAIMTRARSAAARCARILLAAAVEMEDGYAWPAGSDYPVGMAHGSSGIAFALRLLARELPDQRSVLMDGARRAWQREYAHFVPEVRNWRDPVLLAAARTREVPVPWSATWCNGATGIALSRVLALSLGLDEPSMQQALRADLDAGLDSALTGLGGGHTLCHGDAAVADLYVTAATLLGMPEHLSIAQRIGGMFAREVVSRDGVASAGIGHLRDVPGLMSGSAGVGLQLLRIADPGAVPSVLCLAT